MAVASELTRRGTHPVVLDDREVFAPTQLRPPACPESLAERQGLLRVLRHYASRQRIDIRDQVIEVRSCTEPRAAARWLVRTPESRILAENLILTRCAQNQLRRFLASLGLAEGRDVLRAAPSQGLYVINTGEAGTGNTREVLRQAKAVGQAISDNVLLHLPRTALA